MKKFIKVAIMVLLCINIIMISGCFLFDGVYSSSNNETSDTDNSSSINSNDDSKKYHISVIYDTGTYEVSFTNSSNIKIEPRYKDNYILNGYYTSPNGGGNQYLNYQGESVTNSWYKGCYITLYPYYETFNSDYVYKSTVACEEKPDTYKYNVYGDPKCAKYQITDDRLDYVYKVAVNNPYQKMLLTAYADFCDEPTTLSVGIGKDMSTGKLNEKSFSKTSAYVTQSVSAEITGKSIINNENNYILVGLYCQTFGAYGYVKNIYYEIRFI